MTRWWKVVAKCRSIYSVPIQCSSALGRLIHAGNSLACNTIYYRSVMPSRQWRIGISISIRKFEILIQIQTPLNLFLVKPYDYPSADAYF